MSKNFNKTNSTYTDYQGKIHTASNLVKKIQLKEYYDNLKLLCSFYTFMGSALYLFLKRFYLNEIIAAFVGA